MASEMSNQGRFQAKQAPPSQAGESTGLLEAIRRLGPWHQNIQLTDDVSIGTAYGSPELVRSQNENISLINARDPFIRRMQTIFPDGFHGKTILDCACNAGGHGFWAKELGAAATYGFDVRKHWIDQAEFVRRHRTVASTDNMHFAIVDLMDLPQMGWPPADFTIFKGIFYHLADPILGLKLAADQTREILWFNSAMKPEGDGSSLYCYFEDTSRLMSGVHRLGWAPTGPQVIAKMLHWLGFVDIRLMQIKTESANTAMPRLDILAAKSENLLSSLDGRQGVQQISQAAYPS